MTWSVTEFVGQRTEVEGMSMSPTLKDKENLILDKISYRFRDPERYEIVVFPPKYKENTYYIKRVIGLPGETVQISRRRRLYRWLCGFRRKMELMGRSNDPGLAAEPFLLGRKNTSYWETIGTIP
ncbi:MAG: signal peptidase I [Blautia sp.]